MIQTLLCIFVLFASQQAMAQQTTPDDPVMAAPATSGFSDHYVGDLGIGAFKPDQAVLGKKNTAIARPYIYGDYGRFFGRLDTFGIKTLKLGDGYLEFTTRISYDGRDATHGLAHRADPILIGVGTYQETPFGAFFLNGFYDVASSHGHFLEAIYAAEFDIGRLVLYPQIGMERRSANYNNYFYGVTSNEALSSGYHTYNAGASNNAILALSAEYPLSKQWIANLSYRRTWLGSGITDSPIVHHNTQNLAIMTVSYRFR